MNNVLANNLKNRHLMAPLPTDKAQRLADEYFNLRDNAAIGAF